MHDVVSEAKGIFGSNSRVSPPPYVVGYGSSATVLGHAARWIEPLPRCAQRCASGLSYELEALLEMSEGWDSGEGSASGVDSDGLPGSTSSGVGRSSNNHSQLLQICVL